MPQISKIRIVNFNFNDGNRLIADELFDFADSSNKKALNTLINLKNGGGKSVLVQLMLQPIHPKAKTNDRKIESFFTRATDHCFVVIEWLKDNSNERLLTGIAMASGDSNGSEESVGRPVKYYTFLSEYSDYMGKYNIISLPLSKKENGSFVAAAFEDIRKLARSSADKLKIYSSDSGKDWRNDLADYGIIQEEWTHIVEKVNSVEGGMTKFFEGYRDSKQLLDRLLIPTIEGKFGQSTGKEEDSSLETMLLDHSRAYLRQKDLIEERAICDEFVLTLKELQKLAESTWTANETFEKQLQQMTAFHVKLVGEADRLENVADEISEKIQGIQVELTHIDHEKASEEFYVAQEKFEHAEQEFLVVEETLQKTKQQLAETSHKVSLYKCGELYQELLGIQGRLDGIQKSILEKTESSEISSRIKNLAYTVKNRVTELQASKSEEKQVAGAKYAETMDEKAKLEDEKNVANQAYEVAKGIYERTQEAYRIAMAETDKLVVALNMDCTRNLFDRTYHEEDLEKGKNTRDKQINKLETQYAKKVKDKEDAQVRNEQIRAEIETCNLAKHELANEQSRAEKRLSEFRDKLEHVRVICELYNANEKDVFNGFLLRQIVNSIDKAEADKISLTFQHKILEEELDAAEHGYVHVSKQVIDFLDNKGAEYQTCEYYLGSLMNKSDVSQEKIIGLLRKYPEVAYGVILSSKELEKLCADEREAYEWLPALVPVFTHEQLDLMLEGNETTYSSLAFYSEAYFSDRASFKDELRNKINDVSEQQKWLNERIDKLASEKQIMESIAEYNEDSEERLLGEVNRIFSEIARIDDKLSGLEKDKDINVELIKEIEETLEAIKEEKRNLEKWLDKYAELNSRIDAEIKASQVNEEAYFEEKKKKTERESSTYAYEQSLGRLSELEKALEVINNGLDELSQVLSVMGECAQGVNVEGEWRMLWEEYNNLKASFGKELETLQAQEELLLEKKSDKEKSLREYSVSKEEYTLVEFSESMLSEAIIEEKRLGDEKEALAQESSDKKAEKARLEAGLDAKTEQLGLYGGSPLNKDQIKGDYKQRKQKLNESRRILEKSQKDVQIRIREVEKVGGWAASSIDQYGEINAAIAIELAEDLCMQHNDLKNILKSAKKQLDSARENLLDSLNRYKNRNLFREDEKQIFDRFENFIKAKEVKGDRYFSLTEQIDTVTQTTLLRASQIDTDLNEFNQSKNDLLRHCVLQGKRIYDGLKSMSKNSAVSYAEGKGKRQMLRINIPDNIDTNVAESSVSAEIEKGIQEIVNLLSTESPDAEIKRTVNRIVSSATLFRKYVNQDNVSVEVFKIDINPENAKYRTWEATQVNNSGGEKLVLYFAVILSLMNYSRSEYGDIQDKSLTSVLFLDNPFGPVSSEHLLKPMFNIAEHFRVQLICLSDLNKAEITACFDLFIKAKVEKRKYSNKEMLTHEGNEKIEHGYYRSEQMSFVF